MTTTPRIACEPTATVVETAHADTEFKASLRRNMRTIRTGLSSSLRASHDAAIAANIEHWLARHPVSLLGVYWPIQSEPALHELYARLVAGGMSLALPNVVGRTLPLQFLAWTPGEDMAVDRAGIATPAKIVPVSPQALLIPCVAFDEKNYRLGYGGGYYDRTLAQAPHVTAIGVAYSCTETNFPVAGHDIAMHVIITENADRLAIRPMSVPADARSPL